MKKSLVALAVLAATGAYAQSSVTLYGQANAGADIAYRAKSNTTTNTSTVLGGVTTNTFVNNGGAVIKPGFRIQDGNNQGAASSRFGFRGTEDLGGGLKANFVLEAGVNLDDGTDGNGGGNLFSRAAWVGLEGGFGQVRLGRQVLGSFGVHAAGLAPASSSGLYETGATIATGGVRFSNAIQYRSPNFSGFSGTVSLLAPEANSTGSAPVGVATVTTDPKIGVDLSIAFANGPLYVGFGYNKQNTATVNNNGLAGVANVITRADGPRTDYTISAAYDLGVAKPFFNYTNRKDRSNSITTTGGVVTAIGGTTLSAAGVGAINAFNTNGRQYALGVRVPLGAATLITSYGTHKTTGAVGSFNGATSASVERKVRAFQIGGTYALSKRTSLLANYGVNDLEDSRLDRTLTGVNAGSVTTTRSEFNQRGLNVGVSHQF